MTEDSFQEVKEGAIQIWRTYDDTHGYATEKINRIKDLQNIQDNGMYIVAMFDMDNQRKLSGMLSSEAKKEIRDRLIAGGASEYSVMF